MNLMNPALKLVNNKHMFVTMAFFLLSLGCYQIIAQLLSERLIPFVALDVRR